jgi:cobaltochelatase CobS
MIVMPKGVALAMLHPLRDAALNFTNENRKVLRSLMRLMTDNMLDRSDLNQFESKHGITFHKTIDMLAYGALLDHLYCAVESSLNHSITAYRDSAWERCNLAMGNAAACHPKKRGGGHSRGYHIESLTSDTVVDGCRKLIAHYSVPDTRARWCTTTATNTTTNTANPNTQGATMTNATAPSTIAVLDSTGVAVAVASAVVDILGKDTANAVIEQMFDSGMIAAALSLANITYELNELIANDNLNTLDDLSDDLASLAQSVVIAMRAAPTKQASPAKSAPTPASMPVVDPNLAPAVNALLSQATKGALVDIGGLLSKHVETLDEVTNLTSEIARLKSSMGAAAPAVAKTGTVTVDRSTLTYKVVMRRAKDLFPGPSGVTADVLDFDVVTLDWFDDAGKSVRHPDCPVFDATYQFRLRHLLKFLSALKFGQNVWLHGHTGTGKTTLAEQIAARLGYPIERLNLDSNLERADIVGSPEIVIDSGAPVTRFREGILPRAMQQPCMFVLDEIDAGRPDVLFVIQRALEAKGITLTEDGGRTIQPHELFRFVATANSRGQGDEHGWYQGVRPMNLAMLNRFGAFIEVPYLDKDDEERLLTQAYPALSRPEVMEITQFAQEVRVAFKSGEISQTISPRGLHAMAQYFLHFRALMTAPAAMKEAVEVVVIDAAPADCEQRIRELADRVFS